jgi:hypothetical protein
MPAAKPQHPQRPKVVIINGKTGHAVLSRVVRLAANNRTQ